MENYPDNSYNEIENNDYRNQQDSFHNDKNSFISYYRDVIDNKISNVNAIFNIFKYSHIVLIVMSILVILLGALMIESRPAENQLMKFGNVMFVPAYMVVFLVFIANVTQLILEYHAWDVIQDGHQARATQVEAIVKKFIPIYNIYWWYVCTVGLAKDCEKYAHQKG